MARPGTMTLLDEFEAEGMFIATNWIREAKRRSKSLGKCAMVLSLEEKAKREHFAEPRRRFSVPGYAVR